MSTIENVDVRTTVRLDEQLMRQAKALAATEGRTFTSLIEESLRERIARTENSTGSERVKLSVFHGTGIRESLDPEVFSDNSRLADALDESDGYPGR